MICLPHGISQSGCSDGPAGALDADRDRGASLGRRRSKTPSWEVAMNAGQGEPPEAAIEVVPVAGRIGAIVRGVRLSTDIDAASVRAIHDALLRYKVVFFRDQHHLDDAGHEALAARLGEPIKHPNAAASTGSNFLLNLGAGEGYAASRWHTDLTFMAAYPAASILRAIAVPPYGGDTLWANAVTAYDDLPEPLKPMVDTLDGIHRSDIDMEGQFSDKLKARMGLRDFSKHTVFETIHPVVRVHPETGERALILGEWFRRFAGFDNADSRKLYDLLQEHVIAPENTVRWSWRQGDVAIWDNRATQHRSVPDFGDQPRTLRRATIHGDVPRGVDGRLSRQLRPDPERLAAE
jgi:taurine dioxygenase